MIVPFEELPDHARVWIYPSNRQFTTDELVELRKAAERFVTQWTAHGQSLKAAYDIPYDRFFVLGLDQSQHAASGCSIDASVHFIQAMERAFDVDMLDKMNVTYRHGEAISYKSLIEFKKMAKDRAISGKTIVFNNLVSTKAEYDEHWEVPAQDSWHQRFF